ncbi:SPP1 family predicted phage head-tail adaptor [Sphingomonas faeni]|uniref:SPP1 family predicted phage head-tail adaptor n=1 Tax=Sphingomonas faeni TaxID=185950 RepID=A0A2T5UCX8_9SPHN|nr:phage head closure protein [Sphingomonas faeni]PTW49358.1 SPP1 family predicted phage head-tail adaptor [Sphingomonas faeni]
MIVNAGALDRRIEIMSGTPTQDALGQVTEAFGVIATTYAQRLEMRTTDAARAGQRDAFSIARFLIRYRTGITTGQRVKVDGKLYDILAVDEPPPRRAVLILTVEEVA